MFTEALATRIADILVSQAVLPYMRVSGVGRRSEVFRSVAQCCLCVGIGTWCAASR